VYNPSALLQGKPIACHRIIVEPPVTMTAMIRIACVALAFALSLPSQAAGNAEAGATKAVTCSACHGPNGNSVNPEWPKLAGQNAIYIVTQLKHFRDGDRMGTQETPMMPPMAAALSDQDMEDLAAYFSQQTTAGDEADAARWEAGNKLFHGGDAVRQIPACAACHGPVGTGNPQAGYPNLRGQHATYTEAQLGVYHDNARYTLNDKGVSRGGDNAEIMRAIASRLSKEDIKNLAAYIQGMR
jgi:cytochrome c553